jgi:hypothetical protein
VVNDLKSHYKKRHKFTIFTTPKILVHSLSHPKFAIPSSLGSKSRTKTGSKILTKQRIKELAFESHPLSSPQTQSEHLTCFIIFAILKPSHENPFAIYFQNPL